MFKYRHSTPAIDYASCVLSSHLLSGERVVWLLSGGSAIDLEVRIAQKLQTLDLTRLRVGMVDERYGPAGRKDENYVQLMNAYFPLYIDRILTNNSPEATAKTFGKRINRALDEADFSFGIFGIGRDGHTAGIKPNSPAATSTETAVYYESDDYRRITLTPQTIRRLDEVIVYAVGHEKIDTLRALLRTEIPIVNQPAQALKEVANCTLYIDTHF